MLELSQKTRGFATTVVSGSIAGGLNALLVALGYSAEMSTFISLYLVGNILAYVLDILFAKSEFEIMKGYNGYTPYIGPIPYSDFKTRIVWMLHSFIKLPFMKFIVTVILDSLVGLTLLHSILSFLDKKKVHFYFRNTIVAGLVAIFTFTLYLNILRFDWAYREDVDPIFNIIILMWCTIILMVYATNYNPESTSANNLPPPVRNWLFSALDEQS